MSKLEKQYEQLKAKSNDTIYMIRSGIFYVFLNEDAKVINKSIGLKIIDLGPNIVKCGFPISKIEKYKSLLNEKQIKYKIIDNFPNSNVETYLNDIEIKKAFNKITALNMDEISYKQAYEILMDINLKLKNKPTSN